MKTSKTVWKHPPTEPGSSTTPKHDKYEESLTQVLTSKLLSTKSKETNKTKTPKKATGREAHHTEWNHNKNDRLFPKVNGTTFASRKNITNYTHIFQNWGQVNTVSGGKAEKIWYQNIFSAINSKDSCKTKGKYYNAIVYWIFLYLY